MPPPLDLSSLEAQLRELEADNEAKSRQLQSVVDHLGLKWTHCVECATLVDPTAQRCPVCNTVLAVSSANGAQWKCPACCSANAASARECNECGADRPATHVASSSSPPAKTKATAMAPTSPPASSTVKCPACMTINAADAGDCAECGTPLPKVAAPQSTALVAANPAGTKSLVDLSVDGKRESLTAQRARALFADQPQSGATQLRLSTKSFGREAARVAEEFIQGHAATISVADFSDIIASRPTDEALDVLQIVCGALARSPVAHLDLSDNALGERGVRTLEPLLASLAAQLESLSFRNNGLSELAMRLLAEALGTPGKLRKLHFYSNMSGDGGAAAVSVLLERMGPNGALRDFCMSSCRVRETGGLPLARALGRHPQLQVLDLSDSMFGDNADLAAALGQMRGLTQLVLKDAGLKGRGLDAAIDVLAHSELQVLDLSNLELGAKGAARLAQRLGALPSLKVLRLAENELGDKGALALAQAARFGPQLEVLDVRDNDVGAKGAQALADAVHALPKFSLLQLDGNEIKSKAQSDIKALLGDARVSFEGAED